MNGQKFKVPFSLESVPVAKKFIDRPTDMKDLQEVLLPKPDDTRRKLFVLRGLGGIGKTQLAVEFMRLHHAKFSAVLWLNGSSEDSLKKDLASYASRIQPDQISDASKAYARSGEGDVDAVVEEVLDWLKIPDNNRWLIVFDNIDREFNKSGSDPLAYNVKTYIPNADHGSILITTRLIRLEQLGESREVKKVGYETAEAILSSWYKKPYGEWMSSP